MAKLNYYANFEIVCSKCDSIVSGFLAPNGNFIECGWGEHTNLAYEILKENNWDEEYGKGRYAYSEYARDFLIRRKFYILFDNPSNDGKMQKVIFNPFPKRTKVQMNKLLELIEGKNELTQKILNKIGDNIK